MTRTAFLQNLLTLLLICHGVFGLETSPETQRNSTKLRFDDIPLAGGIGILPAPYHHLNFSGFNVFDPRDPALKHVISPHDTNCAISRPNALVGSQFYPVNSPEYTIASINIDRHSTKEAKLEPYFDLLTLWIKPLDAPAPGTSIYIKGTGVKGEKEYEWHVDFPHGYYEPLLVKIGDFTGEVWKALEKVEIWGDFGYDQLDWEFCIDDVEVGFYKSEDSSSEDVQSVLEEL